MPEFLQLDLIDIIDIVLVGLLIYQVYKIIKGTSAVNIFVGILLLYFMWLAVKALHMELLTTILDKIISVGVLALLVVFQPEIRRFLLKVNFLSPLFHNKKDALSKQVIEEIAQACSRMADSQTGALIALEGEASLDFVSETGDRIDAALNRRLIENLFIKNSPMHDGGMIIKNGRIVAVRCTFPMSENQNIPPHFGMRHRAAVGLSEQTDALIVVVSEETGYISTVQEGALKTLSGVAELRLVLENAFVK